MSSKVQTNHDDKVALKQRSSMPTVRDTAAITEHIHPATFIERARFEPEFLTPRDVLQLQRTIGNQAVQRLLQQAKPDGLGARSSTKEVTRFAHDSRHIPVHPRSLASIQAKLTVSSPGDTYEQEADHLSEQVMRMAEPQLQRACACDGGCPECQTKQPGQEVDRVQTKHVGSGGLGQTAVPPIVHQVLRSPGRPLDAATRSSMEQRFGHDFSMVRVHSGTAAEISARDLNAYAYTVGHNIVFAAGQFAPETHAGQRLIAHELTHVVQQSGADEIPVGLRDGNRGPSHSVQRVAERAADGALVQRKDSPAATGSPPKASSGPRGKDDQEQSWANPMKRLSTDPALVGTIYFRTKEWSTDAQDEAVLVQLAKAYAPWAERNVGKKGGERGLRGRIVGYADPRPSVEPNNTELSSRRADIVERRLTRFVVQETRLISGDFEFKKEAGGVAPPAAVVPEPQKYDDDWDRWMPQIEACHANFAKDNAMGILGFLSSTILLPKSFGYTGTVPILVPLPGVRTPPQTKGIGPSLGQRAGTISYGKHGGVLPFTPRKPPWWDARTSGYSKPPLGRQARSPKAVKCDQLVRKTQMMIRDMRELNRYIDLTVKDENSAYLKFMAELRKNEPDVAKLREYAVPIEYLMFMWDALKDSTLEVSRLADALEAE